MAKRRALAALLWALACMLAVQQASSQAGECGAVFRRPGSGARPRRALDSASRLSGVACAWLPSRLGGSLLPGDQGHTCHIQLL